jgi:cell division protein FtsN
MRVESVLSRTLLVSVVSVTAFAATVGAQGTSAPSTSAADSVFRRAIALVDDGEGVAGRAMLDSMVLNTRTGSLEHAEALYWRATVAPTATDAERDYRSILLDHPVSPRIPDVLLRLAQLELTRGHRAGALVLLQRLELEYPNAPNRARTSYWVARAFLDENDVARGCARVSEARSRLGRDDVELRNQIDFLALRCPTAVAAAPTAAAPSTAPPPRTQPPPSTQPPPTRTQPPPMPVVAPPRDTSELVARDTRPSVPRETIPVSPRPTTAAPPTAARTPATPPPSTPGGTAVTPAPAPPLGGWSVQVAAYSTRSPADELVQRLRARGIDARIDGNEFPYRVRVGRYPSRVAASAALRDLQSKGVEGFIVRAGT